jgi:serine/threonine-protein kinase
MGLIHRDVKPSNLLVQQTTAGPTVKILDFGLALVTAGEDVAALTSSQTSLGTPDYVSPEQAKNQYGVDARSDLYSLGCTFFYLLTGETPFTGGTALDKIVRHGNDAPPAVQAKRADVPEPVAAIVHKLLAKNPKWRYQKASELALDLSQVVGKKADWNAPKRETVKRKAEKTVSLSSGDDPFVELDLEDPSESTLTTSRMPTREVPSPRERSPRPRRRKPKKVMWPWIVAAVALAFAVVIGVGLVIRYLMNHVQQ